MFCFLIYFKYNESTIQADKGNTETTTGAEFPGFSTDDNGYVLYVIVDGVQDSEVEFCSFDASVPAPAC